MFSVNCAARRAFAISALVFVSCSCAHGINLRLAAGGEVIPLKFIDLRNKKTGVGVDIRADIVWGRLSTTTLEMGYREFSYGVPGMDLAFTLRRFGIIQRFYPLFSKPLTYAPYVGLGLTASNEDRYSLNVPSADYGGWVVMGGVEIPLSQRFRLDPAVRWDFWASTDYFYSGIGVNLHLVWSIS